MPEMTERTGSSISGPMTRARETRGCSGKVTTAIARDRGVKTKLMMTADRVKRTLVKDFLICFKSMNRNRMYRSSIRNTSIRLEETEPKGVTSKFSLHLLYTVLRKTQ